ncbi:MAG: uridine kinase [Oscillospiraceae bacterium]|nr:uridine kinase [Oscillospiraceae bacterium]
MGNVYVVGIAGGSASGKTTIVEQVREHFGSQIEIIGHDSYYLAHNNMPYEERCKLNYDHPDAFETSRLVEDVLKLKAGETISRPVYDYTIHNRSTDTVLVEPRKIILLEGILVLENEALRNLMDLKVFVDTDADERIMRRISRDTLERGRSIESIVTQYRNTVKPMHDRYVEPTKYYADIIIPWGGENAVGIDMLMQYLKAHL